MSASESHIRRPPAIYGRDVDPFHLYWALIVEDDPTLAEWLQQSLLDVWHNKLRKAKRMSVAVVARLGSPKEPDSALSLMREAPDFVFLDLKVQDSAGLATLERVVAHRGNAHSRICVFSGSVDAQLVRAAYRTGATGVIPKELPTAERSAAIEAFIRHGSWLPREALGAVRVRA